jgi:hypothetical protein
MRSALLSLVLAIVSPLSVTSRTRRSRRDEVTGIALVEPVRIRPRAVETNDQAAARAPADGRRGVI